MSELKLFYKDDVNKEVSKEGNKQELKKNNPTINLIDVYFTLTQRIFKCKNIKIRKDRNVR